MTFLENHLQPLSGNEDKLIVIKFTQYYWKPITFFISLLIIFVSLYPLSNLEGITGNDKTFHIAVYFLLAIPTGLKKPENCFVYIFIFILMGGTIEIIQPYVNRFGELLDFYSNVVGVISGFYAGVILKQNFLSNK